MIDLKSIDYGKKYTFDDLDDLIRVHPDFFESFSARLSSGRGIAERSSAVAVGLARNCAAKIGKSIVHLQKLRLKDLQIFVFENDSSDGTKGVLRDLASSHGNFRYESRDEGSRHLRDRSRERTSNLARHRNACLEWVGRHCPDSDYVFVLDMDADLGFSMDGIYNSLGWFGDIGDAGGFASYSMSLRTGQGRVNFNHYDSFATRMNDWMPTPENGDRNNPWFRNFHPFVGSEPFHMRSCFGGLAVYRTEAFLSGRYGGELGCEHVAFHKSLYDKGYKMYLNPSSVFFTIFRLNG